MVYDKFLVNKRFDREPPKHCYSAVKACRKGFLREGGASRSESNLAIAGGNRTADTSALRREQAAVSAPLEAASYRFSCRSKKTAAGGAQLRCGLGYRMKCFRFRAANCSAVPPKSLYRPSSVTASPCQHHFLWYSCHWQLCFIRFAARRPAPGEAFTDRR